MGPTTGIGRYVRGLGRELARRCELRLYGCFRRGNRPEARTAPPGAVLAAWPVWSRLMGLLARTRLLTTERLLGGCDLFHHTNFLLPVLRKKTPQVMTLHDLAFLRDPSCHEPRAVEALREVVEQARRRCAAFLVPSEATAADCEEYLGLSRDRLFVAPLGVDREFFELEPEPAKNPYLLAVGTIEPRKNFARLIRTCGGVELRIAGQAGWLCGEVLEAARAAPNVHLEGHASDERLRSLMAGASAVAYPSLLEGFGLPLLEAMAAGVPVLAGDIEPLRSVAGDAALLVDPLDEEAIREGVLRVMFDEELRARLKRAGPERARAFTWKACADETLRAYDAVLA